ncbi:unnamed protein product, partial [Prorocentrum cordatum]
MACADATDTTDGDAIMTTLVDISKCFGRVMWIKIIRAGQRYSFPTDILKGDSLGGDLLLRAIAGALPGCTIAMHLLQLTVMMSFDVFSASLHGLNVTLDIYVDDITMQILSHSAEMAGLASSVIARPVTVSEALELPTARDKAKIMGSSLWLAEQVARRLHAFGFETARQITVLGLERRAGARLTYSAIHRRAREEAPHQMPESMAATGPIYTWAQMAHGRQVSLHLLEKAWDMQDPRGHWIKPIAAKLQANPKASKWNLSTRARGAARSTSIGAQWTQQRLYSVGYVDDPNCVFCHDCCGHLHHRLWSCPILTDMRMETVDAGIRRRALQAPPNDLFHTRGLMPRAAPPALPPLVDTQSGHYCAGGRDTTITAEIFAGGSTKRPLHWPGANRAGRGIAATKGKALQGM